MKQIIIIRNDVKMGKGKAMAQACHASVAAFNKSSFFAKRLWLAEGMKKVVLKTNSKKEFYEAVSRARKEKVVFEIIKDAGKTQIKSGTVTALGIGPDNEEKIDKITGKLKLL